MDEDYKNELKNQVLSQIDLSGEIKDEDVSRLIDNCIVDKAKELALGTPEEWAQSEYTSRLGDLANKKASDMTEMEKARV